MQIYIRLESEDEGVVHSSAEQKEQWKKSKLTELMVKLEKDGYRIETLYDYSIFDEAKKEVIDCGEPGQKVPAFYKLADVIFQTGGVIAIIDKDKKWILFDNKHFFVMCFCFSMNKQGRIISPLSIYDVLKNYEELITNKNEELLYKLYIEKHKSNNEKSADHVS